jgi:hypothetical protein
MAGFQVSIYGRALSSDRRNISAMIRATGSGEAKCGVDERIMEDV